MWFQFSKEKCNVSCSRVSFTGSCFRSCSSDGWCGHDRCAGGRHHKLQYGGPMESPGPERHGLESDRLHPSSATTIDVSMTIYTGATDTRANGCWTKGNVGWVNSTAAGSTIGGSSEEHPWQITFSDLSADYTYTIEVVASCICDTGLNIADYTVNGVFADTNRLGIAGVNGDDYDLHADGYVSGNWLIWTDLQPDSNGEITIESTFRKGSDGEYWNAAFINAIRITATAKSIPLPSSIMLLLLDK